MRSGQKVRPPDLTLALFYKTVSTNTQVHKFLNYHIPAVDPRPRGSVNNSFYATQRVAKCFVSAFGGKYPHYQTDVLLLIGSRIVSELLVVIIPHPIGPRVVLPRHWSKCGHCNRRPSVVIGWL